MKLAVGDCDVIFRSFGHVLLTGLRLLVEGGVVSPYVFGRTGFQ